MSPEESRQRLTRLLAGEPHRLDLAEAALLLAAEERPDLQPQAYLDEIDDLTRLVAERAADSSDPVYRIACLRRVLFEDAGFRGDREAFYDPRNSCLDEVLSRRCGIPITLSIVVVAIARRLGWPAYGVSFPLHFLVRYGDRPPVLAIDAFHGGLILGEEELVERWVRSTGNCAPPLAQMLAPAPPRCILLRLLNNLRLIHSETRDFARAARVNEQMIVVDPAEPGHHRDLGYLYALAKQPDAAVAELRSYLEMSPAAADREKVLHCIEAVVAGCFRRSN